MSEVESKPMNAIPACPPEGTWDELAIGLIVGPEADRLLEHASYCVECALHLKAAIEVFGPELLGVLSSIGRAST